MCEAVEQYAEKRREEGIEEGKNKIIEKLLTKGKTPEIIATDLDLDVSFVKSIEEKMLSSANNH